MIKSVVFDWGGVLIKNPCDTMFQYCADVLQVPIHEFQQICEGFVSDFQKGLISEEQLWEAVCSELGCKKSALSSLWEAAFTASYVENTEMFLLASHLKKDGYRIGLLSNMEVPAMRFFHTQHYTIFDITVFSCLEGTWKPEERIYRILLQRLGVQPEEVVFIDDKQEYITAAQKVGLNAILFKKYSQVHETLSLLL